MSTPVTNAGLPLDNQLLASLPRDHFDRLLPHLSTVSLQQGTVLYEAGDEVDQIYFPHFGMLSLLAVLRDGKAIETATVGREGVAGAMAGLGLYKSLVRIVVQLPTGASKIAATHFRTVAAASEPVRNLCIRYNEVLLSQARVTAACNALHPIEARFCRWLLQSADRAASDTVALTQEFLAEMLGVRRTSVTEVASQGAERRRDHLFARRDQDPGSARSDADVLRVLRNVAGSIRRTGLIAPRETAFVQLAVLPVLVRGFAGADDALGAEVFGASVLRTVPHGSEDVLASGIFRSDSRRPCP